MDGFFSMIRFVFGCVTLLLIALVVLAHLPKSPLRSTLVQICGWSTAALCGALVISPLDPIPDVFFPIGFIDDLIALFVGFKAAKAAWNAGKEKADTQVEEPIAMQ